MRWRGDRRRRPGCMTVVGLLVVVALCIAPELWADLILGLLGG
jgi:hypothetical protein